MRVLEFHFNQPKQININRPPDKISRCFCFPPKNIYEKRVGGIFIVGEIVNLLPKNIRLLENLALIIKQDYYNSPLKSIDKSYENCLKAANNFLSQELKNDNVGWLGNLNCAVTAVKDSSFYYAKIGNIQAILLRDTILTNIGDSKGKSTTRQAKSFNDIVYGDLGNNDRLLIMTQGANTIFEYPKDKKPSKLKGKKPVDKEECLIKIIARTTNIDTKRLKEMFNRVEESNPGIRGSCLVIEISDTFKNIESQVFKVEKSSDWFSFKMLLFAYGLMKQRIISASRFVRQGLIATYRFSKKYSTVIFSFISSKTKTVFLLLVKWARLAGVLAKRAVIISFKLSNAYRPFLLRIKSKSINDLINNLLKKEPVNIEPSDNRLVNRPKDRKIPHQSIDTLRIARIKDIAYRISVKVSKAVIEKRQKLQTMANRYLVVSLFLILVFGFVLFRLIAVIDYNDKYPSKITMEKLISQADELIDSGEITKAISILKQALLETESIKASKWPNADQRESLISQIDRRLKNLYNSETINDPSVFFEFKATDFIPQKIVLAGDYIYFYSPLSPKVYPLNIKKKEEVFKPIIISEKMWQISSATNIFNRAAFFIKPNQLWLTSGNQLSMATIGISAAEEISINANYNLDSISSFNGNLYFFEKTYGLIIKYPYRDYGFWSSSEIWAKTKNPSQEYPGSGFLSVNGDAWLLNSENIISVYRAGSKVSSFVPDVYPLPEKFYRAVSVSGQSYLYLLEPALKRLIIIDSFGHTIRQYESPAFDDLRDFAISIDGQTAYILNGSTVYQININLTR